MKIKYMAILLILLCFLIGAASAADDGTVDSLDAAQDDAVSIDAVEEADEVASTEPTSTQTDEKLEQSNDEILKTGTKTVEVNNFDELTNTINGAVNDGENDTYVINLNPGTYSISKATTLSGGTNAPNIIINGNGQSLTGTRQLTINSGCNIVLNNLTISPQVRSSNNNITLNKVVLNNGFTNNMNLYITNSHLNAKISNGGTLTIDENTTATTKFLIDGGKLYINNNPDIINILQDNYVFYNDYALVNTAINKQVVNYARLQIENVTFSDTISNYGEMNIINGTRISSGRIINSGNLTLANSSLPYSTYLMLETNYGNLKFINSTIGCSIINYGNVTIDDDCIIQPAFALEYMEGSNVYYSDMDKISCYRKTFDGNYTIRNMNLDVSQRKNTGTLYFINCTLTGTSLTNTGELYIINNSKSTAQISIDQGGTLTVDNATLGGKIYVQNNYGQLPGNLFVGDNVTFASNTFISNKGNVVSNNPELPLYLETVGEGVYSFTNVNINNQKTNNGDLTLTFSTISAAITNNGNLTIINSTINGVITNNNGNLTIINSTIAQSFICGDTATKSVITVINSTITSANQISNRGTLTLLNTTNLPKIANYGKLIIPLDENKTDAELFQSSFSIQQSGDVETNDINRLFKYIVNFKGETTIELGNYNTRAIKNYGNLTIENSTLNKAVTNYPGAKLVLKNSTLITNSNNQGILYLNNCTVNCKITNTGTLIISDDVILGPKFQLEGSGDVISNKTELIDYVTTYYGNVVLNNKAINTMRTNYGTLTLNNCTVNAMIRNYGGTIIIDDKTTFGSNTQIVGDGDIVINDITKLLPYISIIKGNYIINDATLTKSYEFYGTVTLNNCTITSVDNMNYATMYLNNCTIDVGEDNTFLTNLQTVHVSKDTKINGKINDLVNGVIYEGAPKTYIINQATVSYYFDNTGLNQIINPGDTLDIQGRIILNRSLTINKPVNIISSTKDGYIDLNTTSGDYFGGSRGNAFVIGKSGSYTNVTGVYFHNTQVWLYNTNHVTLDGISVVVENRRVGSGVGVTSIRANSTYVTVKNSYFHTTENEGSSTLVLAWADYCTIENNTIEGDGFVGNLLYITTYNVEIPEDIVCNAHNKLINNRLRGPETPSATCYGICICGVDNLVDNNTINSKGSGIMFQWGSGVNGVEQDECLFGSGENIVSNNKLYGGCGIQAGDIIYNNYMEGKLAVSKAKAYNNTANGLAVGPDAEITNNTILGRVYCNPSAKDSVVSDNTIIGNIEIPATTTNLVLSNNNITGSVTLDGSFNNLTNNRIITSDDYAVSSNKLGQNNNLTGNYLVANGKVGNDAVSLRDPSNVIASAGVATKVEVTVPGEVTVNKTVQVTIKLTDANGNPIDGQVTVSSALGSETVNITKGTGVYQYTPKAIGEDTISVKFAGNDTFYLSSNSSNVNVIAEKAPAQQNETKTPTKTPTKTVVSLSFVKAPKKVSKKAKKLILSAKLKINGKLAKGKKLTFKFKGKTFKVKTNKKGVAKLTIKSKVLKKLLKKVKAGKKVKYQVSYGKKTVKKTLKVKK